MKFDFLKTDHVRIASYVLAALLIIVAIYEIYSLKNLYSALNAESTLSFGAHHVSHFEFNNYDAAVNHYNDTFNFVPKASGFIDPFATFPPPVPK